MILLKPPQSDVFQNNARFRILVAGRRFGKTYLAMVELCRAAWNPGSLVWYVGPTYRQAKRIAWRPLKEMTLPYWKGRPNESDLRIELVTGGTICLRGADNYDSLRGDGLDFLVLDEYASIAREAWPEVLRPALADKQGKALFIGTPHGYNHFYDLHREAQNRPDWAVFQYTTEQGGNVSREEIESATHELDERVYRQEFQASFENLTAGMVYYAFSRSENVHPVRYDPQLPIFWSLDFNIDPMCSVIGQRDGDRVNILAELALENSNTPEACQAFVRRAGPWLSGPRLGPQLQVYGDATGDSRRTSASKTDWQIVKDSLSNLRARVTFHQAKTNPPVKDRVNCVNAMLRNHAGERRLLVDPGCAALIEDLERVHWKTDPHGNVQAEIDKSDVRRTHLSDALGYMIAREFAMRPKAGAMSGIMQ
jgi:hypothetical protein